MADARFLVARYKQMEVRTRCWMRYLITAHDDCESILVIEVPPPFFTWWGFLAKQLVWLDAPESSRIDRVDARIRVGRAAAASLVRMQYRAMTMVGGHPPPIIRIRNWRELVSQLKACMRGGA